MPWKTFLKAHWELMAAADLFTVELPSARGLVRYSVFFVMNLKTRTVYIAGISPGPNGQWMKQIARNLTDVEDGFLGGIKYLILDRDPLYTAVFRRMLKDCGVKCLLLPARSPNLNAFAERFVLSIKSECLNHLIPMNEDQLRRAIRQYMAHYHEERTHQGLGNKRITPVEKVPDSTASIQRGERLGGLLSHYHRRAA
jgi:transposase InsO family protein